MEASIYVILPPKCIEFPQHLMEEIILVSPVHYETQATWENRFFSVPMIKLKMFGVYFHNRNIIHGD